MSHRDDDILTLAQSRFIDAMREISHEDEAGRAVKDLVTSTLCMIPLVTPEFVPEVPTIYTPERVEKLLQAYGERLLESQAEWATRWNLRRG